MGVPSQFRRTAVGGQTAAACVVFSTKDTLPRFAVHVEHLVDESPACHAPGSAAGRRMQLGNFNFPVEGVANADEESPRRPPGSASETPPTSSLTPA